MVNILVSLQGAELAAQDAKCAAALAACRTLAEELSESRFPAPRILAFKVLWSFSPPIENYVHLLYHLV